MIDFDDIERFEENEFDKDEYQRVNLEHKQQMTQHKLKSQNNDTPPRSANNNQIDQESSNYIAIVIFGFILIEAFIWLLNAGGSLVNSIIIVGGGAFVLAEWILR